jgi:16S rRNA (uracil1498-N3)-methyltransferase
MELYYVPELPDGEHRLDEQESRHCAQVLRRQPGDRIQLTNGRGGAYEAVLTEVGKKACYFEIGNEENQLDSAPPIALAVAPTKNASRFEWLLEKATEIGVREIYPLISKHSERRKGNLERWNKVLVSAMKQSARVHLPRLHDWLKFQDLLKLDYQTRMIAHCDSERLRIALQDFKPSTESKVLIAIGPEGDFDGPEIEAAEAAGFQAVHLGDARLRTETAGLVALHTLVLAFNRQA